MYFDSCPFHVFSPCFVNKTEVDINLFKMLFLCKNALLHAFLCFISVLSLFFYLSLLFNCFYKLAKSAALAGQTKRLGT